VSNEKKKRKKKERKKIKNFKEKILSKKSVKLSAEAKGYFVHHTSSKIPGVPLPRGYFHQDL